MYTLPINPTEYCEEMCTTHRYKDEKAARKALIRAVCIINNAYFSGMTNTDKQLYSSGKKVLVQFAREQMFARDTIKIKLFGKKFFDDLADTMVAAYEMGLLEHKKLYSDE